MASVFVGQLPFSRFFDADLYALMEPYGTVVSVRMRYLRGEAFVLFQDVNGADAAIAALHGRRTLVGRSRPLQVIYAASSPTWSWYGILHSARMRQRNSRVELPPFLRGIPPLAPAQWSLVPRVTAEATELLLPATLELLHAVESAAAEVEKELNGSRSTSGLRTTTSSSPLFSHDSRAASDQLSRRSSERSHDSATPSQRLASHAIGSKRTRQQRSGDGAEEEEEEELSDGSSGSDGRPQGPSRRTSPHLAATVGSGGTATAPATAPAAACAEVELPTTTKPRMTHVNHTAVDESRPRTHRRRKLRIEDEENLDAVMSGERSCTSAMVLATVGERRHTYASPTRERRDLYSLPATRAPAHRETTRKAKLPWATNSVGPPRSSTSPPLPLPAQPPTLPSHALTVDAAPRQEPWEEPMSPAQAVAEKGNGGVTAAVLSLDLVNEEGMGARKVVVRRKRPVTAAVSSTRSTAAVTAPSRPVLVGVVPHHHHHHHHHLHHPLTAATSAPAVLDGPIGIATAEVACAGGARGGAAVVPHHRRAVLPDGAAILPLPSQLQQQRRGEQSTQSSVLGEQQQQQQQPVLPNFAPMASPTTDRVVDRAGRRSPLTRRGAGAVAGARFAAATVPEALQSPRGDDGSTAASPRRHNFRSSGRGH